MFCWTTLATSSSVEGTIGGTEPDDPGLAPVEFPTLALVDCKVEPLGIPVWSPGTGTIAALAMSGTATIAVEGMPDAGTGGVEFGERERSPCPMVEVWDSLGRLVQNSSGVATKFALRPLKSVSQAILPRGSPTLSQMPRQSRWLNMGARQRNDPSGRGTAPKGGPDLRPWLRQSAIARSCWICAQQLPGK